MEIKEVVVTNENAQITLDKYLIFEYKCLEQRNMGNKTYFKFERDNEVPYYEELVKLEQEYGEYKIKSMTGVSLMPIITFVLVTIFLVVFLIDKEHFNFTLMFSLLMIPALLVLVFTVALTVIKLKAISKINKEKPNKDLEYKEKVDELKARK